MNGLASPFLFSLRKKHLKFKWPSLFSPACTSKQLHLVPNCPALLNMEGPKVAELHARASSPPALVDHHSIAAPIKLPSFIKKIYKILLLHDLQQHRYSTTELFYTIKRQFTSFNEHVNLVKKLLDHSLLFSLVMQETDKNSFYIKKKKITIII